MMTISALLILKVLGGLSVVASLLTLFIGTREGAYKRVSAEMAVLTILWAVLVGWAVWAA